MQAGPSCPSGKSTKPCMLAAAQKGGAKARQAQVGCALPQGCIRSLWAAIPGRCAAPLAPGLRCPSSEPPGTAAAASPGWQGRERGTGCWIACWRPLAEHELQHTRPERPQAASLPCSPPIADAKPCCGTGSACAGH